MRNEQIKADDSKKHAIISYQDRGQGEPVVLLHGFCGSGAYWEPILPLLEANYRLIVPDLRGHGASASLDAASGHMLHDDNQSCEMEDFADDLARLLDKLGLERIWLFGHSLGGYITLAFAEHRPERLKGFSLVHSTAHPDDEKGKESRLNAMKTIEEKGLAAFLDGLVPRLFAPEHAASMPQKVSDVKQIGLKTNEAAAVRTIAGMRSRPDRNHVLEQTDVPVLLIAGKEDQIVPPSKTFSVSGKHITQKTIDQAGHLSMLETPEALAALIRDWTNTQQKAE